MLKKIKGTLDRGLATMSVKSESLVETGRTKAAIANLEDRLHDAEAALGKRFYELWKQGGRETAELAEELTAVDSLCAERDKLSARLEQIRREEEALLSKTSGRFCMHCGKPAEDDAKFCMHCGSPLRE